MIAANTITKGQTFKAEGAAYTAISDVQADKFSLSGGFKVLVTDGVDEFWHLFGFRDMVSAA